MNPIVLESSQIQDAWNDVPVLNNGGDLLEYITVPIRWIWGAKRVVLLKNSVCLQPMGTTHNTQRTTNAYLNVHDIWKRHGVQYDIKGDCFKS